MLDEKERTRKIKEFNDGIVFEKEIIKKKRDVKDCDDEIEIVNDQERLIDISEDDNMAENHVESMRNKF